MYVKFETTSKSTKVQAAIDAVVKGAKLKAGTEYENILKNHKNMDKLFIKLLKSSQVILIL